MQRDDDHADPEAEALAQPSIPVFFGPSDLPEWLRPPPGAAAPAPEAPLRSESARARGAWRSPGNAATPAEAGDFEAAAATGMARLVPSAPRPTKRRRGLFGLGSVLSLMVVAA